MRSLLVIAALVCALPANASVLFKGDFETGDISQWSKAQIVSPDRIQIVSSPLQQGSYAARVEVRQGDDPINASGNRSELVWTSNPEQEGDERWYGWSTLWPDDYPSEPTWQLFVQWHHSGCCGSPPVEFYVNGETMYLRLSASEVVWSEPLVRGKWHEFVVHAKWSSDPEIAYMELWYDGELVLPKTAQVANMYAGDVNYLKMGLYRNDIIEPTGVIFHDAMTVATTQAEVELPPLAAPPGQDAGAEPDAECSACAGTGGGVGGNGASELGGATGWSGAQSGGSSGSSSAGGSRGWLGTGGKSSSGAADDGSCSVGVHSRFPFGAVAAVLALAAFVRRQRSRLVPRRA